MSVPARYFHSVRHLRPIQIAGRLWLRLYTPRPDLTAAPRRREMSATFAIPVAPEPTLIARDVFRFLGAERRCASARDWQPADAARLWAYCLHYFDDLNARGAHERRDWHRDLLQRWVAENPPATGTGWEPYPASRRIVNWIKWALAGNRLPAVCETSLAVQVRWLRRRLEYHLLGNHLLANAKALVFAGLYFDGAEADGWLDHGLRILGRELGEQILADGGHFELSPMYHAAVLEDLLDLCNVSAAYERRAPAQWLAAIASMQHWLQVMSHPDGDIAFFNDAAFGMAPAPRELRAYAARLHLPEAQGEVEPLTVLAASGYVRAIAGAAYLICDCAQAGPDYLPGHAHADTLSFELSVGGSRWFVNSGISEYGTGEERQRQRGTAAHNTVVVDGADSSEVWGGFRVARRARACLHVARSTPPVVSIEASHDGYRFRPGRNTHRRKWTLNEHSLRIEDRVSGSFARAEARFHLHPQIEARARAAGEVELRGPNGRHATLEFGGATEVTVQPDTWHPQFGLALRNHCVVAAFAPGALDTHVRWQHAPPA